MTKMTKMTKFNSLIAALILQLPAHAVYGQQPCDKTPEESLQQAAVILNEQKSKDLWNVTLNAPLIIIDHIENKMYFTAIEDGEVQPFREEEWNNKVTLANSFSEYEGKRYVTIIHAALANATCEQRINILAHEIFHLHQNSLGIENTMSANYHIDEVEGRALLQIEMKALQQALDGNLSGLFDALCVRAYRQSLYPDNNEDLYELNEGLAEYTGAKLSGANMKEYAKARLTYDIKRGYANAFAYFTGSSYACILDQLYPTWRYDKDLSKGMTYLIKKVRPEYAVAIDDAHLRKLLGGYDYDGILSGEREELKSFGNIAAFEDLIKPGTAKLRIINRGNFNLSYNPNDRIITLSDGATLLRNITIMAELGEIKVTSGIVRPNDWSTLYLLPPQKIEGNLIKGDDYEIRLNQGWRMIEKDGLHEIVKES
ncbi:MAG: hypothetical protein LBJ58_04750 [Tannerellaceae bacterium]|jgi:hypothetical protein|nr:hypothetical protein [Tannerellaceae bacterium]